LVIFIIIWRCTHLWTSSWRTDTSSVDGQTRHHLTDRHVIIWRTDTSSVDGQTRHQLMDRHVISWRTDTSSVDGQTRHQLTDRHVISWWTDTSSVDGQTRHQLMDGHVIIFLWYRTKFFNEVRGHSCPTLRLQYVLLCFNLQPECNLIIIIIIIFNYALQP